MTREQRELARLEAEARALGYTLHYEPSTDGRWNADCHRQEPGFHAGYPTATGRTALEAAQMVVSMVRPRS
jgi:hypothetical protein